MYYIFSDKRSKKSALLIYHGLVKCLDSKPLSEITVTDIYNASSVSRSTFYRLFDNVTDVLLYECDLFIEDITTYVNNQKKTNAHDFFVGLIEICMQHHHFFKITTMHHHFELIHKVQEHIYHTLGTHFIKHHQMEAKKTDYFMTLLSMSIIGIFTTWVKHGCKDTPEQLFQYLKDCSSHMMDFYNFDISLIPTTK